MDSQAAQFGEILREKRELHGISRKDLAKLAGVHVSYISRLESGSRLPSRETALVIGELLRLGPELNQWLMAAGFAPVPNLNLVSGASRTRGGTHHFPTTQPLAGSLHWTYWLQSLGLEEVAIERLLRAMENVGPQRQRELAKTISGTLALITRQLETKVQVAVIPAAKENRLIGSHVTQRMIFRAITEAANAGIPNIVLVLAPNMQPMFEALKEMCEVTLRPPVNLKLCVQSSTDGLGDAVLQTEDLVEDSTFVVLLPDDVVHSRLDVQAQGKIMLDMISALNHEHGGHVLAVTSIDRSKLSRYGVAVIRETDSTSELLFAKKLIEKPGADDMLELPARTLGVVGRYVLQPSIFSALRHLEEDGNRPLDLTTALEVERQRGVDICCYELKGTRYDIGEVLGRAAEMIETATKSGSVR